MLADTVWSRSNKDSSSISSSSRIVKSGIFSNFTGSSLISIAGSSTVSISNCGISSKFVSVTSFSCFSVKVSSSLTICWICSSIAEVTSSIYVVVVSSEAVSDCFANSLVLLNKSAIKLSILLSRFESSFKSSKSSKKFVDVFSS